MSVPASGPGGITSPARCRARVWLPIAAWAAIVLAGSAWVERYGLRPGLAAGVPAAAPPLVLDPQRPTLVMFAHPRCPCTRSSLHELEHVMTRCVDRASALVLFYQPQGAPADWADTDLCRLAAAIPGVQVRTDPGGGLAHRLSAATSGQVFVFAPDGRTLFSGGITGARGHEGGNPGRDRAEAAILAGPSATAPPATAPVYGCALDGCDGDAAPPQDPEPR